MRVVRLVGAQGAQGRHARSQGRRSQGDDPMRGVAEPEGVLAVPGGGCHLVAPHHAKSGVRAHLTLPDRAPVRPHRENGGQGRASHGRQGAGDVRVEPQAGVRQGWNEGHIQGGPHKGCRRGSRYSPRRAEDAARKLQERETGAAATTRRWCVIQLI